MLLLLVAGAAALRAPSGLRCPRFTGATVLRSSTTEIMMPALSSTMTSGRVVSWLKNVGDKIEAGDPIIVVESDSLDTRENFENDDYRLIPMLGFEIPHANADSTQPKVIRAVFEMFVPDSHYSNMSPQELLRYLNN